MANIRPVETILLVLLLAFTAANIGTEARYLMKRLVSCDELQKPDCDGQKGEYLFKGFRNITMKFFADCINLFFVLVNFICVNFLSQKYTPKVPRVVFFIILALTLMSLGSGLRSIDEEDEYNEKNFTTDYEEACTAQSKYDSAKAKLDAGQALFNSLPAQNQATLKGMTKQMYAGMKTQLEGLVFTNSPQALSTAGPLKTGADQLKAGISGYEKYQELLAGKTLLEENKTKVTYANLACRVIGEFKEIYEAYRNSLAALVIINFVLAYTAFVHSVFRWTSEEEETRVKIISGSNLKLQEYKSNDALKVPQTDIELNAQNAM